MKKRGCENLDFENADVRCRDAMVEKRLELDRVWLSPLTKMVLSGTGRRCK